MRTHYFIWGLVLAAANISSAFAQDGQSLADFQKWSSAPVRAAEVSSFEAALTSAGVSGIIPTYQLLRTSSSWRQCANASPFEVAPPALRKNMIATLKLVKAVIVPAIGPVEALSAFRNDVLNLCSKGKPGSAHRTNWALDLKPNNSIAREDLIKSLCNLHKTKGAPFGWGLGFYAGIRFHSDTMKYRRWGSNGSGATSPCKAYD